MADWPQFEAPESPTLEFQEDDNARSSTEGALPNVLESLSSLMIECNVSVQIEGPIKPWAA